MKIRIFLSEFTIFLFLVMFSFVLPEETFFVSGDSGANTEVSYPEDAGVFRIPSNCYFGFNSDGVQRLHFDNTYEKGLKYIQLKENNPVRHSFRALFVPVHSFAHLQQSLIKLRRLNI